MGEGRSLSFSGGIGLKIVLPTLAAVTLFVFPALLAWHGMNSVQDEAQEAQDYSQALGSLRRIGSEIRDEARAGQLIVSGSADGAARFAQASGAIEDEMAQLMSLPQLDPETGWISELSTLIGSSDTAFRTMLAPASATGDATALAQAQSRIAANASGIEQLLARLEPALQARSASVSQSSSRSASMSMLRVILSMAAAGLIGLAGVSLVARRVKRPAVALAAAAEELSHGNLEQRVAVGGRDELGRLGQAFNKMAASLELRKEALVNERTKLRSIHQSTMDGVLVVGNSGFLVSANPAAESILGRTESELAGSRETGIPELDEMLRREELAPPEQHIRCWEHHGCRDDACPAYESDDLRCWLQCGTHCHEEIQGTFACKREACERCTVYRSNSCARIDCEFNEKSYAISLAPMLNDRGTSEGRLAVLHDMTEERHRARQLGLLYEIANAIALNTDISASLQETLDLCIKAMKATSGSILLIADGGELVMAAQCGLPQEAVGGFRQKLGEGIAGWVAQQGEPLLLTGDSPWPGILGRGNAGPVRDDPGGDSRLAVKTRPARHRQIRDAVCLPIRDETKVVGVLSLNERRTPEGFTTDSLDFLSPVAVQIGMALTRAQLHKKVAQEKEKQAAIMECMGESMCVRGRDRKILFANSVHKEIFGDDCVGKHCYELYLGRDSVCSNCPLDRCFDSGETVRRSHLARDCSGGQRQLEATATPLRDAEGKITSCIEISRDVTEMLRIRDQARSRLETLTTLFEVSSNLSSSLELTSIVDNLADSTRQALRASTVAIMLLDGKRKRLVLHSLSGDPGDWELSVGDSLDVALNGLEPLVSGSGPFCATVPEETGASLPLAPPGSKSILVGRLASRGKLLGLISVSSSIGYAFSEPGQMELFMDITNQAAVAVENADMYKRLEKTFWSTIRSLAEAIDAKDSYTRGHSDRVAEYAEALARELDLEDDMLNAVRCAGYLHDTGKIGIPDAILLKPGRLTEAEYGEIMRHPVLSHKIIEPVDFPYDVKPLVRHHHERIDGNGYPDGLKGDEIPLGARIICIADAYEAMTSDRPYRKALSHAAAVDELLRCAGSQFDADLVSAFISVMER